MNMIAEILVEGRMKEKRWPHNCSVLLGFLLFGSAGFLAAAQWQAGMTFGAAAPQGAYKGNIGKRFLAPGFGLSLTVQLGRLPLYAGIDAEAMSYRRDTRQDYVFVPEFGDISLCIDHDNQLVQGDLFLRLQTAGRRPVRLYADLIAGLSHSYSTSSIPAAYDTDEDTAILAYDKSHQDTVFRWGIGAGLLWQLGRSEMADGRRILRHGLEMGLRYTRTREALYLGKDSILIVDGLAEYRSYQSAVSLLSLRLGYVLGF